MYRLLIILFLLTPSATLAADLPSGFIEKRVATGLTSATAMAFAPDGRLFVCQQSGELRVIKAGVLLSDPFVTVSTDDTGERGLLGVAFDPSFSENGFVYVYYTALTSPRHNVVARFTADGDRAVLNSEQIIFTLDDLSTATIHNGGAMHFGLDGKLYIAVGENGSPQKAESLDNVFGKLLRIDPDGSIPSDNPFLSITNGNAKAIWALGLRNPFTFDVQPNSGRIFINDVGENSWEEINDGAAGSNYGWPQSEGPDVNAGETAPFFSYSHGLGVDVGCAVTGGAFYNPSTVQFPTTFVGKYFFADFCSGWIRTLDPATKATEFFAGGLSLPVDLKVGPDGSLYYLARGSDSVDQIVFTGSSAPFITAQPGSVTVSVGDPATFNVEAVGAEPLSYQWRRNGSVIDGATASSLTISNASFDDNGARFEVVVSNSFGTATSTVAVLTVSNNQAPVATITSPLEHTFYMAGDTVEYSGVGADAEDGFLPASSLSWQVDFHHDNHVHPFLPATPGASGSFVIPVLGEKSANVWYRLRLTATDSAGRTNETFRDILPRVSEVTLTTQPVGLQLMLDGQVRATPASFTGVAGIIRNISTAQLQVLNGTTYEFVGWSDGGDLTHDISTPPASQTITALFTPAQDQKVSELQFAASTYEASESDPFIEVTVMRKGDLSTEQSVDYATADDTASDRSDYLPNFGRLFFAPNESTQTIRILLTNGATPEDSENFTISLFNASSGAALAAPSIARLTILDDDDDEPRANPIDDAEFFVRQHYQDFLNREPDPAGLAFWTREITGCGSDSTCKEIKRQNVSAAFFLSIEFQETGFLVYRLNRVAFGKFPTFMETLRDTQQLGSGVIVGESDWEIHLAENRRQYLDEFVTRPEFLNAFPLALPSEQFVNQLDQNAGFSLTQEQRDSLVKQLEAGTITRVEVLKEVAEADEFRARELNRAFVLFQYFGYLRRNPDDTPDLDFDGYEFWLNKLNQFNGNFERAEMVRAFIDSLEYRGRFRQ